MKIQSVAARLTASNLLLALAILWLLAVALSALLTVWIALGALIAGGCLLILGGMGLPLSLSGGLRSSGFIFFVVVVSLLSAGLVGFWLSW
jgi:hypothetical protein